MKNSSRLLVCFLLSLHVNSAELDRSWFKTDEDIDSMYGNAASQRGAAVQRKALENIVTRIQNLNLENPEPDFAYLTFALRQLPKKNVYQLKERIDVYDQLQAKLISTPGHAQHLTSRLANARKNTEQPWMDGSYILQFDIIRQTLIHLPSPETIWETGKLLEDPSDLITHEMILERKAMKDPTLIDWRLDTNPRNLAAFVFNEIGLRSDGDASMKADARLKWWEEVKSGKRTFSFKGQSVEYRFLPDGTWESIPMDNPPDDDPRKVVAVPETPKQNAEPTAAQPPAPEAREIPRLWMMIGIAGVLLLIAAGWRMFRRKSHP
jgi:hypothetical protein